MSHNLGSSRRSSQVSTASFFSGPATTSGVIKGSVVSTNRLTKALEELNDPNVNMSNSLLRILNKLLQDEDGNDDDNGRNQFKLVNEDLLGDFGQSVDGTQSMAENMIKIPPLVLSAMGSSALQGVSDASVGTQVSTENSGFLQKIDFSKLDLSNDFQNIKSELSKNLSEVLRAYSEDNGVDAKVKGFFPGGGSIAEAHRGVASAFATAGMAGSLVPVLSVASAADSAQFVADSSVATVVGVSQTTAALGESTGVSAEQLTLFSKCIAKLSAELLTALKAGTDQEVEGLLKSKLDKLSEIVLKVTTNITTNSDQEGEADKANHGLSVIQSLIELDNAVEEIQKEVMERKGSTGFSLAAGSGAGFSATLRSFRSITLPMASLAVLTALSVENKKDIKNFSSNSTDNASSLLDQHQIGEGQQRSHSDNLTNISALCNKLTRDIGKILIPEDNLEDTSNKDQGRLNGTDFHTIQSSVLAMLSLSASISYIPLSTFDGIGAISREASASYKFSSGAFSKSDTEKLSEISTKLDQLGLNLDELERKNANTGPESDISQEHKVSAPGVTGATRSISLSPTISAVRNLSATLSGLSEFARLSQNDEFKEAMKEARNHAQVDEDGKWADFHQVNVDSTNAVVAHIPGINRSGDVKLQGSPISGTFQKSMNKVFENMLKLQLVSNSETKFHDGDVRGHLGASGERSDALGRVVSHGVSVNTKGSLTGFSSMFPLLASELGISVSTVSYLFVNSFNNSEEIRGLINEQVSKSHSLDLDFLHGTGLAIHKSAKDFKEESAQEDGGSESSTLTTAAPTFAVATGSILFPRLIDIMISRSITVGVSEGKASPISEALGKLTKVDFEGLDEQVSSLSSQKRAAETEISAGKDVFSKLADEILEVLQKDYDANDGKEGGHLDEPLLGEDQQKGQVAPNKNADSRNQLLASQSAGLSQSAIISALSSNISMVLPFIKTEQSIRLAVKNFKQGANREDGNQLITTQPSAVSSQNSDDSQNAAQKVYDEQELQGKDRDDNGPLVSSMDNAESASGTSTQVSSGSSVVASESSDITMSRILTLINSQESIKNTKQVIENVQKLSMQFLQEAMAQIQEDADLPGVPSSTGIASAARLTLSRLGNSLLRLGLVSRDESRDQDPADSLNPGNMHTSQRAILTSVGNSLLSVSESFALSTAGIGGSLALPVLFPGSAHELKDKSRSLDAQAREFAGLRSQGDSSNDGSIQQSTKGSSADESDECGESKSSTYATASITGGPLDTVYLIAKNILDNAFRNLLVSLFASARSTTVLGMSAVEAGSATFFAQNPVAQAERESRQAQGEGYRGNGSMSVVGTGINATHVSSKLSVAAEAQLVAPSHEVEKATQGFKEELSRAINAEFAAVGADIDIKTSDSQSSNATIGSGLSTLISLIEKQLAHIDHFPESSDDSSGGDLSSTKITKKEYVKILLKLLYPELEGFDGSLEQIVNIYRKGGKILAPIVKDDGKICLPYLIAKTPGVNEIIAEAIEFGDEAGIPEAQAIGGDYKKLGDHNDIPEALPVLGLDQGGIANQSEIEKILTESRDLPSLIANFATKGSSTQITQRFANLQVELKTKDGALSTGAKGLHKAIQSEVGQIHFNQVEQDRLIKSRSKGLRRNKQPTALRRFIEERERMKQEQQQQDQADSVKPNGSVVDLSGVAAL